MVTEVGQVHLCPHHLVAQVQPVLRLLRYFREMPKVGICINTRTSTSIRTSIRTSSSTSSSSMSSLISLAVRVPNAELPGRPEESGGGGRGGPGSLEVKVGLVL